MLASALILTFLIAWGGIAWFALRKGQSKVIAVGGGLLGACVAIGAVMIVAAPSTPNNTKSDTASIATASTVLESFTGGFKLFTCGEHEIRQCKFGNATHDCLFTNTASVPVQDGFYVWQYDADDVLLDKGDLYLASSASPGSTVHAKFFTDRSRKPSKVIVCSVDPKSELGRTLPLSRVQ